MGAQKQDSQGRCLHGKGSWVHLQVCARFRLPTTTLGGLKSHQALNQCQVGPVAQKAPLLHHREQLGLFQGFQLKGQVGWRQRQGGADLPR